ncbi:hypothetical protein N8I77_007190 [Diaporthe amygdali]|uniref:Cytochrome P450 n=1 Tax=Phomopsis amygdali TaxID=1214568 RepID=A0AAD9SB64_PHOAM|nr:hypothetical protein N8I77_007190 [Diaporthe amygdali]
MTNIPVTPSRMFNKSYRNWWQKSTAESKARGDKGHFSFWLGHRHVVGVSGEAGRKLFFEDPRMDFASCAIIRANGENFPPPIHQIFRPPPGVPQGRADSFFLRLLLACQKTDHLKKYLPRILRDARVGFENLPRTAAGVTRPADDCYRIVFTQDARLFCSDEIADDPQLNASVAKYARYLLQTHSNWNVLYNRLPSPSWASRRIVRYRFYTLLQTLINERISGKTPRKDDPMQTSIDKGTSLDWMVESFLTALFVAPANSSIMTAQMLNIMAIHTDWQAKIYGEIQAAAAAHSTNKDKGASLLDKLDSMPLESWETSFPSIELCLREVIRMWTSFNMGRLNTSKEPVPIPGSDHVVPGNTFIVYNSTEVNFSEKLYPNPYKFDPGRFLEGREEYKQETNSFTGWGMGRHPCTGIRLAKVQQNIVIAYALAMYEWVSCDKDGVPTPHAIHVKMLNSEKSAVLPTAYTKLVPRKQA